MFSRNTERPPTNDGRPPAAPTTPPGVRDVSVPVPPPREPPPAPASVPADLTLIGRADRLEGTLKVADTLRIQGTLEGSVEATTVHIDEGAKVRADITADEVIIGGDYSGKLVCRQRLEDPGDRPGRGARRDLPADAPRGRLHRRRAQDAQAAGHGRVGALRGSSNRASRDPALVRAALGAERERRRRGGRCRVQRAAAAASRQQEPSPSADTRSRGRYPPVPQAYRNARRCPGGRSICR